MKDCIKCERKIKVNYSCYEIKRWDIYICHDCESEYWLDKETEKEIEEFEEKETPILCKSQYQNYHWNGRGYDY